MEEEKTFLENLFERVEYLEKENSSLKKQLSCTKQDFCNLTEGKGMTFWEWDEKTDQIQFFLEKKQIYFDKILKPADYRKNNTVQKKSNEFDKAAGIIKKILSEKKENFETELKIKTDGGDTKPVCVKGIITERNKNGNAAKVFGVVCDIAVAPKKTNDVFPINSGIINLIKNGKSGIVIENSDQKIYDINSQFCDLFEIPYSSAELIGRGWELIFELIKPRLAEPEKFSELLSKRINEGQTVYSDEIMLKNGKKIYRDYLPIKTKTENIGYIWQYSCMEEITKAEYSLNESETEYRDIITQIPDGFFIIGLDSKFKSVNNTICDMLGYTDKELLEMSFWNVVPVSYKEKYLLRFEKLIKGEIPVESAEYKVNGKNDRQFIVEVRTKPYIKNNIVVGFQGFARDITERKNSEQIIKESLYEKEILIKELYHRTKNNMQVICSLMGLIKEEIDDIKIINIFKEMENRIRTMSLVHQKLYQSKNLSKIDFGEYIYELAIMLSGSYEEANERIKISTELESVMLLMDTALPCGLLLNELISNSFKHAFPEQKYGTIEIKLKFIEPDIIQLNYSDDGIGFKREKINSKKEPLGLLLIMSIAKEQLQGDIIYETENGVNFQVRFKDSLYYERI